MANCYRLRQPAPACGPCYRTGFEMFTSADRGEYVAEKAETETGWLFPVGDEVHELGYLDMFADMFESMDAGKPPMETFYDGYVVNAIIDACYRSAEPRKWEPVELFEWRGRQEVEELSGLKPYDDRHYQEGADAGGKNQDHPEGQTDRGNHPEDRMRTRPSSGARRRRVPRARAPGESLDLVSGIPKVNLPLAPSPLSA